MPTCTRCKGQFVISRPSVYALACAALVVIWSPISGAQEPDLEELQRKLEQRDSVIRELLERVEALERRIGISRDGLTDTTTEPGRGEEQPLPKDPETEVKDVSADVSATETAPGEVVVDEEAAERALERSLTQTGALLLRPGRMEVEPRVVYARNEDAAPTFISRNGNTLSGELARNVDSLTGDLAVRLGLPRDTQLEVGIPYRWRRIENVTNLGFSPVDTSSQSAVGLGDLRLGVAKTLLRENIWRPDLVGRVTWDTKTGRRDENGVSLGGGFDEIRASLTAINRQDPVVFLGAVSYEYVFENDRIRPGATIASNLGGFIALSPETSLRLLVSGAYQQETEVSDSSIDGSDQVAGSFVIGGSTLLFPGTLLNLSVGIGLTDDADDFSVSLSIPIRLRSPVF